MMTLHLIMLLPFLDFWAKQTMKICRKTKSYYIQWLCWLGPRCCYHAAHSVLVYVQCDSVTISVVPAYKCTNTEYSIFSIIVLDFITIQCMSIHVIIYKKAISKTHACILMSNLFSPNFLFYCIVCEFYLLFVVCDLIK